MGIHNSYQEANFEQDVKPPRLYSVGIKTLTNMEFSRESAVGQMTGCTTHEKVLLDLEENPDFKWPALNHLISLNPRNEVAPELAQRSDHGEAERENEEQEVLKGTPPHSCLINTRLDTVSNALIVLQTLSRTT